MKPEPLTKEKIMEKVKNTSFRKIQLKSYGFNDFFNKTLEFVVDITLKEVEKRIEQLLKEIEKEIRRLELKLDWIYYRWKPSFQRFKNPKPKKEEPEINWLINDQTMFGVSGALKALKFSKTLIKKTFSGMVEE